MIELIILCVLLGLMGLSIVKNWPEEPWVKTVTKMKPNPHRCIIKDCNGFNYTQINPFKTEDIGGIRWTHNFSKHTFRYKCTNVECILNKTKETKS